MPRPVLCFPARGIIRDARTGNISAFSIFEQINAENFPVFIQSLDVLALWRREPTDQSDIDLQFRVRNNEHTLIELPVRIPFSDHTFHRSIVNLSGIVVQEAGELHFEFLHGEHVLTSYLIDILVRSPRAHVESSEEPRSSEDT